MYENVKQQKQIHKQKADDLTIKGLFVYLLFNKKSNRKLLVHLLSQVKSSALRGFLGQRKDALIITLDAP